MAFSVDLQRLLDDARRKRIEAAGRQQTRFDEGRNDVAPVESCRPRWLPLGKAAASADMLIFHTTKTHKRRWTIRSI
jgi:hypothetical protein